MCVGKGRRQTEEEIIEFAQKFDSLIPDVLILSFILTTSFSVCSFFFQYQVEIKLMTGWQMHILKIQVSMESELISQIPFALWSWISEGAYYKPDITLTSH